MRAAPKQAAIAVKYQKPFWSVVADLHAQSLSVSEAAQTLGYSIRVFSALRARNPDLDPWTRRETVAEQWEKEHGETFEAAIKRLAKRNNKLRVSQALGFKSPTSLERYIQKHDIEVTFSRSRKPLDLGVDEQLQRQASIPRPSTQNGVIYTRRYLGAPQSESSSAQERYKAGRHF